MIATQVLHSILFATQQTFHLKYEEKGIELKFTKTNNTELHKQNTEKMRI